MFVQVRQHDVLEPPGNACVVEMKGMPGSHRVCCLELFGSVTILEVQWHWGQACAVLQPISVHKEAGWVRTCLPMSEDIVLAGVHEQYLAALKSEEKGPDWHPPEAPRVAGVPLRSMHSSLRRARCYCSASSGSCRRCHDRLPCHNRSAHKTELCSASWQ